VGPLCDSMRGMESDLPPDDLVAVPVAWVGLDVAPPMFGNQFLLQVHDQDVWLCIGAIQPPLLTGSEAERKATIEALPFVPIRTVARVAMNPQRLRELADVVNQGLKILDGEKEG
jgi:hypothetical protein